MSKKEFLDRGDERVYISEIKDINNYRNLSGKRSRFNQQMNFLIGENNIGKTNVLELITTTLSTGKFLESDFFDITKPISVKIVIRYTDDEIGFFDDNFDVDDHHAITILVKQDSVDERAEYYHDIEGMPHIAVSTIKKMNVLYYYAQRMPSKEVDFRKNHGAGKVLNYLVRQGMLNEGIDDSDILKKTKIKAIVKSVNKNVKHLNSITGDNVYAHLDQSEGNIIGRLLQLGDENNRNLDSLGEGIQYAFNMILQILECIYSAKKSRKEEVFNERLINRGGKKFFPVFMVLDEPEIHQHPYRQRSIVKKIQAVMCNQNEEFITLLQDLFGIDGLTGQIFIATHSPNILLNDYHQYIRIYKEKGNSLPKIVSGMDIQFDDKLLKHLLRNYMYMKEVMFSRGVIFVEGDTEYGAIPVFADRMNISFDDLGIGIVKLDGADGVRRSFDLYTRFGIKAMAVLDKDKKDSYSDMTDVFFTKSEDYESEIYDNFDLIDFLACSKELDKHRRFISVLKRNHILFDEKQFLMNPTVVRDNISEEQRKQIMEEYREHTLSDLKSSKNASKGAILATYVTIIPKSYQRVIEKIIKEVKG